ncbi:MAG TPA: serine hydrolase [Cyclobacteriaceae bacterium]|nr:serine hydrolase [Cyclobacteriaceae bacterium]
MAKFYLHLLLSVLALSWNCDAQSSRSNPLKPAIPTMPIAKPSSVGMTQDTLSKVLGLINSLPERDFRALVVIKDNKLIVEEYFNTYWRETIHDVRSAGKGITALLLGIAIDKGLVASTEQSIYDFFPATKNNASDAMRKSVKIKHLLNMSSGLYADDNDDNAPGNTANWLLRNDWVDFAMTLPKAFTPGDKYVYSDVCPMLIGAIIEKQSGMKLSEFANINLFQPLGIREFYWYTAPNGSTGPMGNLYLSALDFAKIGQLIIHNGDWEGRRIVSASWTKEICTINVDISKEDPFARGYGNFWFKTTKKVGDKSYDCVYASGNGGNLLF